MSCHCIYLVTYHSIANQILTYLYEYLSVYIFVMFQTFQFSFCNKEFTLKLFQKITFDLFHFPRNLKRNRSDISVFGHLHYPHFGCVVVI